MEPTWTSSVDFFTCPAKFEIYRIDDTSGARRALTPAEVAVLTFDPVNGFVDLETNDFSLVGETWVIWLTKESIYSSAAQVDLIGPLGIYVIEISFFDACADAGLTAAAFAETEVTFDLFAAQLILFSDFTSDQSCGGVT